MVAGTAGASGKDTPRLPGAVFWKVCSCVGIAFRGTCCCGAIMFWWMVSTGAGAA